MKKVFYILGIAIILLATSCTSSRPAVSEAKFLETQRQMEIVLANNGYAPSGQRDEQKNEIVVTGQSYSRHSGYGTLMDNDYSQYRYYTFTDSEGNTMEYSLKYKLKTDEGSSNSNIYIVNTSVMSCKTSKAADYNTLCNGVNSPYNIYAQMTPDTEYKYFDWSKTTVLTCVLLLPISLIPLLMY